VIHDHDAKLTAAFYELFRIEGAEIVLVPSAAPSAKAIAERVVGTVRRECLDRLPISGRPHLQRVRRVFVDHDIRHRPHRALGLRAPDPAPPALRPASSTLTGSDM
jgi:putative transposase